MHERQRSGEQDKLHYLVSVLGLAGSDRRSGAFGNAESGSLAYKCSIPDLDHGRGTRSDRPDSDLPTSVRIALESLEPLAYDDGAAKGTAAKTAPIPTEIPMGSLGSLGYNSGAVIHLCCQNLWHPALGRMLLRHDPCFIHWDLLDLRRYQVKPEPVEGEVMAPIPIERRCSGSVVTSRSFLAQKHTLSCKAAPQAHENEREGVIVLLRAVNLIGGSNRPSSVMPQPAPPGDTIEQGNREG